MLHTIPRRRVVATSLVLSVIACAEQARTDTDASQTAPPAETADGGCSAGMTLSCACSAGGAGLRRCEGGAYGRCEGCAETGDRADDRVKCVAGRYRASTHVSYRAGPAGICFIAAPEEATILDGMLTFTLDQDGSAEFYTVGNGCIRASGQGEDAGPSDIDWRAEVVGHVDCRTGELTAEIRSTYFVVSVCTLGQVPTRYFAKGPFHATYNPDTKTFEDGTLSMREPPVLFGDPPGGDGVWTATLDPDVAPVTGDAGACLGDTVFDDSLFPPDAGS